MMKENRENLQERGTLELIFVNDSPDETITSQDIPASDGIDVILRNNEKNVGIHGTRVAGLSSATGTYVMFFDQDDKIAGNYFVSQLKKIGKADVVVSNGIAQYKEHSKLLYRYGFMQQTVKFGWFYVSFDCRIISPGQCLIAKDSIPEEWTTNVMKKNGADDKFLWLLMLSKKKSFAINRECIYTHIYTGENASDNMEAMRLSQLEFVEIGKKQGILKKRYISILEKKLSEQKEKGFLTKAIERMNRM